MSRMIVNGDDRNSMFTIVIPILNQHEVTERYIESWFTLAKGCLNILFIDNGSDTPLVEMPFIKRWQRTNNVSVLRNEENIGVYPTFQQGFDATDLTFIFYSHNDVEMLQYGWDIELNNLLQELSWKHKVGVCGMYGARRLGTPDIYRAPYHFTQLQRGDCVTVEHMHNTERRLEAKSERVAVLDGFSLIVNRDMVYKAMRGKFDHESFPPHHMYDIDICIESHYGGYSNFAIDIDCIHHGGKTSCGEKWAEKMGTTDLKVHRKAHEIFYKKWRGKLPVVV